MGKKGQGNLRLKGGRNVFHEKGAREGKQGRVGKRKKNITPGPPIIENRKGIPIPGGLKKKVEIKGNKGEENPPLPWQS